MSTAKGKLLPFYLVMDVSYSMQGDKLASANQIMPTVLDALATAPILSDKVRFAVLDFADDARVRLPLCDLLAEDVELPELLPRGATSYAAAFRLLRKEIGENLSQLKADGFAVHRPVVFFLSDGVPTDADEDWRGAFAELTGYDRERGTGFAMYPNFVPFGVAEADPATMRELIHPPHGNKRMRMYLMAEGQDPARAITAMAEILVSSVLASGNSLAAGSSGVLLPDQRDVPPGVRAHTADDDFV
ncbi:uncharacterized protein YegL [Crossiella equi]|uniref:Uncharacterized protein YegL n=1 Tax=Crossiella equi TaxID=130796 RepID=A0ABS5APH6_9PSEU|nr:VWA domain-containing protein [Crossiella equi]MBP2478445.1 uncharacterized protein YegL [Crossiella equi]